VAECNPEDFKDPKYYTAYLKNAVEMDVVVLYINSLRGWFSRAPDGGCWLFSAVLSLWLRDEAPFIPRGCRNVPISAEPQYLDDLGLKDLVVVYLKNA